jgi:hypothetical protein
VTETMTLDQRLDRLAAMFADNYDWEAHWERDDMGADPDDVFRECFKTIEMPIPNDAEDLKGFACGSASLDDTPRALYRLLYLAKPASVDFSDMYKSGGLFVLASPDRSFFASVETYKYELGLYFYAKDKSAIGGEGTGIIGGWPGADNRRHVSDPIGAKFFDVLLKAVNREWDVYSGNNFKV